MMKRYVVKCHFNRQGEREGFPWTVHYRGKCLKVKEVYFGVHTQTEYHPNKKSNPRGYLRTFGVVEVVDNIAFVTP